MRELIEVLMTILVGTIFMSVFLVSGKIIQGRERMLRTTLRETAVKFEIILKDDCIFEDEERVIRVEGGEYVCGRGRIRIK